MDDPDGEYLKRNRWFESGSLQQGVSNEPGGRLGMVGRAGDQFQLPICGISGPLSAAPPRFVSKRSISRLRCSDGACVGFSSAADRPPSADTVWSREAKVEFYR